MESELHISFFSDWHCGSGLGESHLADAVICRDTDGIPIIPGRAVKGALREGAWRLCALGGDYEQAASLLFGSVSYGGAIPQAGHLYVASARLPQEIRDYLRSLSYKDRTRNVSHMVTRRSCTALRDGVAAYGSLRTLECGIPGLAFVSRLTFDLPETETSWLLPYMAAVCAAVKSMGADRARGLGRCSLRLVTPQDGEVPVPDLQHWRMACAHS